MSINLWKKILCISLVILPCFLLYTGCQKTSSAPFTINTSANVSTVEESSTKDQVQQDVLPNTWHKANVLVPTAPGTLEIGNSSVTLDLSNTNEGYFFVSYLGDNKKVKLQLTGPNQVTYTYNITEDLCVLPLTSGSGTYQVALYENIISTQYSTAYNDSFDVSLTNEYGPYLYPNMYVHFTADTKAIRLAETLCSQSATELEAVSQVYHYVVSNISYDYEEAETVAYNYLPDVDEVLETQKGICFDYAALMAAMLRGLSIPTRLEIGYAGEDYHAWISVYIKDQGWIDGIIQFDGQKWTLMDPTYASTSGSSKSTKKFITNKDNYNTVYSY